MNCRNTGSRSSESISCIVYGGVFAALMAVGAFIKIMLPVGPFLVTFSLQIFVAVLAGLLLGMKTGFFSVLAYLVIGLCGFPVFAHGGGLTYMLKPTFGFLIGFAAAAFVSGLVCRGSMKLPKMLFAAFLGEMAYYACGLVYYALMVNLLLPAAAPIGPAELIEVWFLSTVIPDLILCLLAAFLANRLLPIMKKGLHT